MSDVGAAPELLRSYTESYEELVSHEGKVWACRYGDTGSMRLVIDDSGVVDDEVSALPPRTLRFAVAPDGVFYAVAVGDEPNINPSAHLWEKPMGGSWTDLGVIREVHHSSAVFSAELVFVARSVVVNLNVQWSTFGGGTTIVTGAPADPPLVLFDREARSFAFGQTDIVMLSGNGPLYARAVDYSPFFPLIAIRLVRSEDGINWTDVTVPVRPLNTLRNAITLGTPFPWQTSGNRLFFKDDFTPSISVMETGGGLMRYEIPFSENGFGAADATTPIGERYNSVGIDGLVAASSGEYFVGFCRQTSQEGGPTRHLVVCSNDYLQSFEFYTYFDDGYIDSVIDDRACYFLRATTTGTALHRVVRPAVHIPPTQRPKLTASSRMGTFFTGLLITSPETGEFVADSVERLVIDLLVESDSDGFFQLETSTDLKNWTPVALPVSPGKTVTFLINPEEPRRFYR